MPGKIVLTVKAAVIAIIAFVLLKIVGRLFRKHDTIHIKFIKSFLNVLIVILATVAILNLFEGFQVFSETILTSSSLLVVVLGFAFQSSLTDFIAGILISFFKPFEINDRIILKDENISGTIEDITIRHTVIRSFTNSRLIVPNSIMNKAVIENNHIVDPISGNFMDVQISYTADIELAKSLMTDCIESNPLTINPDAPDKKSSHYTYIFTREFTQDGICLRGNVWTRTVDDNFRACSEIRDAILREFDANGIEIPHRKLDVTLEQA